LHPIIHGIRRETMKKHETVEIFHPLSDGEEKFLSCATQGYSLDDLARVAKEAIPPDPLNSLRLRVLVSGAIVHLKVVMAKLRSDWWDEIGAEPRPVKPEDAYAPYLSEKEEEDFITLSDAEED
jgi:hypothetical protein